MKILRVNMSTLAVEHEDLPPEWLFVGGRGLIAKIMNREVPPASDPLGPENKLIIACGPLAGTMAPQLGRISVGSKSPLTLGIRSEDIIVSCERLTQTSARNVLEGSIKNIISAPARTELVVACGIDFKVSITSATVRALKLKIGTRVFLLVKARAFRILT